MSTIEEQKAFCDEINEYLKERFKYRKSHACLNQFGNIRAVTKKFDLYLRLTAVESYWRPKTFVIARMGFLEVRVGNGKDVLIYLNELCIRFGFEKIGLESTNLESAAFAIRFGFKKFRNYHYIIDCHELRHKLHT